MARHNKELSIPPSVSPEKGIELIEKIIEKGGTLLKNRPIKSDVYDAWENTTREYLIKAFGSDSPNVSSVMDIGKGAFLGGMGEEYYEKYRAEDLSSQITMLKSLVELLNTEIELNSPKGDVVIKKHFGDEIFLVHGRNEGIMETIARFLEKLDLKTIVLHEQPNEGRTIIEKFENFSNVGFAIILLTSDDRGGLLNDNYASQKPRARQNVILELGYFLGKLGRKRVCAVYQEGTEIPSDYNGVLYIKFDEAGNWRLGIAKELKAAGISIDMNKAL